MFLIIQYSCLFMVLFIYDSCIFRVLFIQDSCIFMVLFINYSCIFMVLFIHDSCIFRVLFIHASCIFRVLFIHDSCLFRVLFIHDSCLFRVLFIHDSCLFRVLFRHVLLYIWWKVDTIMCDGLIETLLETTHWSFWVIFLDMKYYVSIFILAHLNHRVIWIIVNTWRPSSSVVFRKHLHSNHPLLYHLTNWNQTW
jgi:hypothetical protein